MAALELALDVAFWDDYMRTGELRKLAVVAEAWALDGMAAWALDVAHVHNDMLQGLVAQAYKGRPLRLLRADARGMLQGLYALADTGVITTAGCSEAARLRWVARGGHSYVGLAAVTA